MRERVFSEVSRKTIGCAIEVHRVLGPGLLESTYERCMAYELERAGIKADVQRTLPVNYKGLQLDCGYRVDIWVNQELVVELKSVEKLTSVHEAQLLTYMKLGGIGHGLLINFNVRRLRDGLKSYII